MGSKKDRRPSWDKEPPQVKNARVGNLTPDNIHEFKPVWRFQVLDMDGEWSWRKLDPADIMSLLGTLRSYETMKWREICDHKSCGSISKDKLSPEAQARLAELEQDDAEELFKLRINKKSRVWGIRDRQVFKILWWDPEHQVYPMNPTNN